MVADAKYYEIREPTPRTIYLPAFQDGKVLAQNFVLRTNVDPTAVAGDLRRTLGSVLKTVPVAHITALSDQVDSTIVAERLIAALVRVIRRPGIAARSHRPLRFAGLRGDAAHH